MPAAVRIAIVGLGHWGTNYVRTLRSNEHTEIAALVDLDAQARARAAVLAPRAALCSTLSDSLSASVDAVIVCTPSDTHAAITLEAVSAGKHVLVEKPLATSTMDGQRVATADQKQNRVLVGHLTLHHPAVAWLERTVRSGLLGKPLRMQATRISGGSSRSMETAIWALAPHDACLALRLLGPPEEVRAQLRATNGQAADVHVRFAAGGTLDLELSRVGETPTRATRIECENGTAMIDERTGACSLTVGEDRSFTDLGGGPALLDRQYRHFMAFLRGEERPMSPASDGLAVVELLAAAERSALDAEKSAQLDSCTGSAFVNENDGRSIQLP